MTDQEPAGLADLRLAGGAQGFNWLPVFVADEQGLFEKHGIRIDYKRMGSVEKATAAVLTAKRIWRLRRRKAPLPTSSGEESCVSLQPTPCACRCRSWRARASARLPN